MTIRQILYKMLGRRSEKMMKVREYLIDLCNKGETVELQELCDVCELKPNVDLVGDRAKVDKILKEISKYEKNLGRPPITEIVVVKHYHLNNLRSKIAYGRWRQKIKLCFEFWSNKENYNNFRNIKYE